MNPSPRRLRLAGRSCLIVGGTSGIGLATARRFLEEGAKVVVCGRADAVASNALAQLNPLGPVWLSTADASAPDAVRVLFREALDHLGGRIDVLFHVAGISGRAFGDASLADCTLEGWSIVMDVNAKGTFLTNQAAVRQMLAQEVDDAGLRGTVLNMGSVLAGSPSPDFFGTFAYAASKGAVQAMTLNAAARYARDRIRFNLIAPAVIDTPMAARAVGDPAIGAYLAAKQPMAGGAGSPDDCAEAALYLCEPASRFVTGAVLNVDGGWRLSEGRPPREPSQ